MESDAPTFIIEVPCKRIPHDWRLIGQKRVPRRPARSESLWVKIATVFGPMAVERRWYCTRCRTFETTVERPGK